MYWYPMHIDSKQHLFDLDITQSFKHLPEVYFQVHLMQDDSIRVFWRTPISRVTLGEVIHSVREQLNDVDEIWQRKEYYLEIDKKCPLQSIVMQEDDAKTILQVFHDGLPRYYQGIYGYDGHEFELTRYGDHPQKLHFWCLVRPDLAPIAEMINLIVEKALPDSKHFWVRISDND